MAQSGKAETQPDVADAKQSEKFTIARLREITDSQLDIPNHVLAGVMNAKGWTEETELTKKELADATKEWLETPVDELAKKYPRT